MKTSALSLAIAISSALALTACGGGGSSGGSTAKPSTPVVKPNPTNPTNQAGTGNNGSTAGNNNATPNNNNPAKTQISGEAIVVDDNAKPKTFTKAVINHDNINQLSVNGKTLDIGSSNIISGGFNIIKTEKLESIISGTHMKYAKYGILLDDSENNKDYFFYQGEKTPIANIPTTGTATYTGRSLYDCKGCEDAVQGTSKFTVDFGKKTLSGSISNEKVSDITLNATITGNTFSGKSQVGIETNGAFFGNNAQEVSGTYMNNDKTFGGAFGATKQ